MALNSKNGRSLCMLKLDSSFTDSSIKSYKHKDTNGVLGFPSGQIIDGCKNILVKYRFQLALFLLFYPVIHSLKVTSGDTCALNQPWYGHFCVTAFNSGIPLSVDFLQCNASWPD